jgi:tetratricopeptide (TPR) repeat protein
VKIHPHDQVLQEFATLSEVDSAVVDHLAECQRCQERVLSLVDRAPASRRIEGMADILPWPTGLNDVDYGPAIEAAEKSLRLHARALAVERAEAPRRVVELLEHPPERREMLMRNHPRFQTWGLLERLIDRVKEETWEAPEEAADLARLALSLADCLDVAYYGAERIDDLISRTWGYAGNARRVASDFTGAGEAFEKALRHLRKGTGDPLERALLLDLKASLLREQRRFDAAMHLLTRALRIYRDLGETHRAGRVLVKFSTLHEHAGTPERAIPLLQEALILIDVGREPRLLLSAQHNLITNLAEAGRFMEAHGLFIQARPLYARFPDPWTQNRRHWIEGRIARGLGQTREAEEHLLAAQGGFLAEKSIFDTALVSLDLAALYTVQRRTAELKEIAEETIAIFSWSQMHRETRREALVALSYLCQAVAAERASLEEVVARVAAFLKRLRHDPGLPFRQPEPAVNVH